jgi:hypothetical protein
MRNVDETLQKCQVKVEPENIPYLYTLVENHFKIVQAINANNNYVGNTKKSLYEAALVPRIIVSRLLETLQSDPELLKEHEMAKITAQKVKKRLNMRTAATIIMQLQKQKKLFRQKDKMIIRASSKFREKLENHRNKMLKLEPAVEGRSILITDPKVSF